jgi:Hemerythrin HHE cation binding domain
MNTAVVRIDERRERVQAAAAGQRVDMYTLVHKGIRAFMGATLEAAGRADPLDREEVAQTLERVRSLAGFLRAHLHHENQFIHPALEARRPGSARRTANDHVGHERAIESLEIAALAVEKADDAARPGALLALYRELALFVAENLEHMHVEETENNAQLWAAYSDEELQRVHGALMGSMKPDIMQLGLRWMVPSMNPAERAGLLSKLPAEWLPGFRPHLGERDWAKLCAALGPVGA